MEKKSAKGDVVGKALLVFVLTAVVLITLWAVIRQRERRVYETQIFAMDTVMTLTAYGPHGQEAVEEAARELYRLDGLWSVTVPTSEIAQLNAAGEGELSADSTALLKRALTLCEDTGGLFDCTIYPLVELWGFPTDRPHVPTDEDIADALPLVDSGAVTLEDGRTRLGSGQRIDLGGIAKGFASARIMEIFRSHGVKSGMVSLGGNVQTLGSKPDGTPWRIGIRVPGESAMSYLGVLDTQGKAVITSGGYERYFEEDGEIYIHILDPRTGRPAQSDLLSATVVSSDGTLADALSTATYIMGVQTAADYWRASAGDFDLILLDRQGTVWITEGIAQQFQCDLPVTVLKRS